MIVSAWCGDAAADEIDLTHSIFFHRAGFVAAACHNLSSAGCTNFTDIQLTCACSFEDYEWRIRWAVKGKATSFVTTPAIIRHETLHVSDVRARLQVMAGKIGAARFGSETVCERELDAVMQSFPSVVHDLMRTDVYQVDRRIIQPSQIIAGSH